MEKLPQRRSPRNQKLVRKNGGLSGYSTKTTTRPEQVSARRHPVQVPHTVLKPH
ncbi:hypothetical protein BDM02DRAFT_3119522 [Thelephora ganbajun]|uniref:Uncharacterized protein n=1 Tax=Thelephora ganbajun TaxID=370292 RepID=A0ACB6Z975_THEGA|nr:hypothetical protein BDM02DRAFT_3119522 [Thelephora ganbajun]